MKSIFSILGLIIKLSLSLSQKAPIKKENRDFPSKLLKVYLYV